MADLTSRKDVATELARALPIGISYGARLTFTDADDQDCGDVYDADGLHALSRIEL